MQLLVPVSDQPTKQGRDRLPYPATVLTTETSTIQDEKTW